MKMLICSLFALTLCCAVVAQAEDPNPQAKYDAAIKDAKVHSGFWKLYEKEGKLYLELSSGQLNKDYIVALAIARGISERFVYGGLTLGGGGDDWLWQFRKVDENIHVVRRNVRFTAKDKSPEERAVKMAYTDSILFSLPIIGKSGGGGMLVDLTPVFMSDLPQLGQALPGFSFQANRSTWAAIKSLKRNTEIEVAATYASPGIIELDSVPDSRAVTINVHYSISELPSTGYKPRLADDRVGYFTTVIKDFSKKGTSDQFVRYVNRWDLQKSEPDATLSPPVQQIIFYIEKTVPFAYRKPIREGIEEWNKAFEKIGFANAIEVRQQPDDAEWDPEDINYNTFRWITAGAGFAMGPSRANPTTGQILDADIIFDADFLRFWRDEYERFNPKTIEELTGGPLDAAAYLRRPLQDRRHTCSFHRGHAEQMAFGAAVAMVANADVGKESQERMIMEGLKEVTMHEVGHTLGLRHNFKASAYVSLADLNSVEKTATSGLTASVMDYSPVQIGPKGVPQGRFYSHTIGLYDTWAIEYGYKPGADEAALQKIAARSGEPGLWYATDEDTRGIDSDPLSNRFDLGNDPVGYAKQRAALISGLWPDLVDRVTQEGEGYQDALRAFGVLLRNYGQATFFAARYVGGVYVNRDHKGDAGNRKPYEVVPAARQREALQLLEENIFNDKPFQFPPEMYNSLATSRWSHWGVQDPTRVDLPVHEVILQWQDRVLDQLLATQTLSRLYDSELKVAADQDALTCPELLERLSKAVFAEVETVKSGEFTNRKPAVSSLRRNLQRSYLRRLANLALGNSAAPQDVQTVAYAELAALHARINDLLKREPVKLDGYTKAHLTESASRIQKTLDADLSLPRP